MWPLFLSSANFGKSLRFAGKCNFLLVEFLLWKCLNMWLLPSSTPFLLRPTDVPQSTNEVVTPFALNLLLDKSFKVHFHHIAHTQCNAMHTFVTHSKCDYNSYLLHRALKSPRFSVIFKVYKAHRMGRSFTIMHSSNSNSVIVTKPSNLTIGFNSWLDGCKQRLKSKWNRVLRVSVQSFKTLEDPWNYNINEVRRSQEKSILVVMPSSHLFQ